MEYEKTNDTRKRFIERKKRKKEEMGLFKRNVVKKTSGILALLLIISVLTPILAFAGVTLSGGTYQNGELTGVTVRSDVDTVGNSVYLDVYSVDANGGKVYVTTAQAVYDGVYSAEYRNYTFPRTVVGTTYSHLQLVTAAVYDGNGVPLPVTDSVYRDVYAITTGGGSCCGGGGGGGITNTTGQISVSDSGIIDSSSLANTLNQYTDVTIKLAGDFVILPVSALLNADGRKLTISGNGATYVLQINVNQLKAWADKLGVDVNNMKLRITIAKVSGTALSSVQQAATAIGGSLLADPIEFAVTAEGNDKTYNVEDMGVYTTRTLTLNDDVVSDRSTGAVFNPTSGTFSFVPSTFSKIDENNAVTIQRRSNSIYTVVSNNKSFADISGHWAKLDIELLANKLVIDGVTSTTFEPERSITRAEFAALVVRALGLSTNSVGSTFKDVALDAWYAGVVNAAANAGIINGYEDSTFRPDRQINREELSAMVVRALKFAGVQNDLSPATQAQVLSTFKDANQLTWGKSEVAMAIDAGIINGMTPDTLAPRDNATRAQSATMLKRLLNKAGFIN
jgi:hypothetical protein